MAHLKKIIALGMTVTTVASLMPMTSLAAHYDEWVKKDGKWYYYDSDGKKVKYSSVYDNTDFNYYVLNSKGERVTKKGWYTTNYKISHYGDKVKFKTTYYLKTGGAVTAGWKKISGKYYYFDYTGAMVTNRGQAYAKEGSTVYYLLGSKGTRIKSKGWHQVKYKSFDRSRGLVTTTKVWYYVKSDGTLQTGWKKIKGKYYYFDPNNGMETVTSEYSKDGKKLYLIGEDGARITKKGWASIKIKYTFKDVDYTYSNNAKYWYYIKSDGSLTTGWKKISGKWYYFDEYDGRMAASTTYYLYNEAKGEYHNYYFNKKGVCTNY